MTRAKVKRGGSSSREKRSYPRFPVGISMDLRMKGRSVAKCRGTITDLSVSGMSFRTDQQLEEGSVLFLKVNIPMEIRGEVRHIRTGSGGGLYRYGVRFHKISCAGEAPSRPDNFISAKFQKK